MSDHYLLLTPILTLLIVALVGFVGCGFQHGQFSDPTPFDGPANIRLTPGDGFVDVSWDSLPGASSYTVKHGAVSGDYPDSHAGQTTTSLRDNTDVVNGTRYFYVVTAFVNGYESTPSPEASVVPGISLVIAANPGTRLQNFDGWVGIGFHTVEKINIHRLGRLWLDNKSTQTIKLVDSTSRIDIPGGACDLLFNAVDSDGYSWCNLDPAVTLQANTDYFLVCRTMPGEAYYDVDTTVTTTPAVGRVYPVYADAVDYYISNLDGHVYGPVNFTYSVSP